MFVILPLNSVLADDCKGDLQDGHEFSQEIPDVSTVMIESDFVVTRLSGHGICRTIPPARRLIADN